MLRRSHKKSRTGCLQCKRRHVKCDESRPVCRLCTVSGRDCIYASQASPESPATSGVPSHEESRGASPGNNHTYSLGAATIPDIQPLTAGSSPKISHSHDLTLQEAINLNHMELLIHLTVNKEMFNLGDNLNDYPTGLPFALKTGLESPYLLYQMLAFSARHLAFLHPERSASYLHQAVTLQTRAVSLFNSSHVQIDESNSVAVLLFSTALGHHLLADTLAKRHPGGLDTFLTHYIQCAEVLRGVYTIAITARPLLVKSELEPILSRSWAFTSRTPRGTQCQRIRELVDSSRALDEEDKHACQLAINYLQLGFDAVLAVEENTQYQMMFLWTVLVPPRFTILTAAKRPEALVLLGYFASLLHYGRHMWQVGDAGVYLLSIVAEYLGPEWEYWLEYPRETIAR